MRSKLIVRLLVLAGGMLIVAGCGSSSKGTGTTTVPASTPATSSVSGAATLTIKNFSFSPKRLAVKAGQTITITNDDSTVHTVTSDGGEFDTGNIAPGMSKNITLTKAGIYHYHCTIHTVMTGEIDVAT